LPPTSPQAAAVRGAPLHSGAKALILKVKGKFLMVVLPADRSLNNNAFRKLIGSKTTRFATKDEVFELTSLTPGSIPPFGSLFGLQVIPEAAYAAGYQNMGLMVLAPGAFILLGLIIWIMRTITGTVSD
jgi:Ala-tRNA(Pro) deacylase